MKDIINFTRQTLGRECVTTKVFKLKQILLRDCYRNRKLLSGKEI